jgi:hypothetical protein
LTADATPPRPLDVARWRIQYSGTNVLTPNETVERMFSTAASTANRLGRPHHVEFGTACPAVPG